MIARKYKPVNDKSVLHSSIDIISLAKDRVRPIKRREFVEKTAIASFGFLLSPSLTVKPKVLESARVGIIGLDTSHCEAFTKILNSPDSLPEHQGFRVTAAYPYGSK